MQALVLLEGDARGLSPAALEWTKAIGDRLREVAAQDGIDAVLAPRGRWLAPHETQQRPDDF